MHRIIICYTLCMNLAETINHFGGVPEFVKAANAYLANIHHQKRLTSSMVYGWLRTKTPGWMECQLGYIVDMSNSLLL